jgi:hypothetical protein
MEKTTLAGLINSTKFMSVFVCIAQAILFFMVCHNVLSQVQTILFYAAFLISGLVLLCLIYFVVRPSASAFVALYVLSLESFIFFCALFSISASQLADASNQRLYADYFNIYAAVAACALIFGFYYSKVNPDKRRILASLKIRYLKINEKPSLKTKEVAVQKALLVAGLILMALLSIKMGRAEGLLYSTFLFSLILWPYMGALLIVNLSQFLINELAR